MPRRGGLRSVCGKVLAAAQLFGERRRARCLPYSAALSFLGLFDDVSDMGAQVIYIGHIGVRHREFVGNFLIHTFQFGNGGLNLGMLHVIET